MNNFPDELIFQVFENLSDNELINIPYNRQSYHCSRYVMRKRVFERGWLSSNFTITDHQDAYWVEMGFASWRTWVAAINQLKNSYPVFLPAPQNTKKKFFPNPVLNDNDLNELKNYRRYKSDGTLDPAKIQEWLFAKLIAAETVGDQYRYMSALMHFPLTEELMLFWQHVMSPKNKRALLLAEEGGTPPLLFRAVLQGNMDYLELLTENCDANTWRFEKIDILNYCFRAIGLLGNKNITEIYLEKLELWDVYDRVLSAENESLFKALRDAAKYGHEAVLLLLLDKLPRYITTRKGTFDFKIKMLISDQPFVKELASRDTTPETWAALERMIPVNDEASAQEFLFCVIYSALNAQNHLNAHILFQMAEKRNLLQEFFQQHLLTCLDYHSQNGNLTTLKWLTQQARAYAPESLKQAESTLLTSNEFPPNIFVLLAETHRECTTKDRINIAQYWWKIAENHQLLNETVAATVNTYVKRITFYSTSRDEDFLTWMGGLMGSTIREVLLQNWNNARQCILSEQRRLEQVPWGANKAILLNRFLDAADYIMSRSKNYGIYTLDDLFNKNSFEGFTLRSYLQFGMPKDVDSPLMLKIKWSNQAAPQCVDEAWRDEFFNNKENMPLERLQDLHRLLNGANNPVMARELVAAWQQELLTNPALPEKKSGVFNYLPITQTINSLVAPKAPTLSKPKDRLGAYKR